MTPELAYFEAHVPDCWSEHRKARLQIAVWHGLPLRDIKSALRSEISQGAVMGKDDLKHKTI